MATFFDREPNRVSQIVTDRQLVYHFAYYAPGEHDKVGTRFTVVSSPSYGHETWQSTLWYVKDVAVYQPERERELTPEEVAHFEAKLASFAG